MMLCHTSLSQLADFIVTFPEFHFLHFSQGSLLLLMKTAGRKQYYKSFPRHPIKVEKAIVEMVRQPLVQKPTVQHSLLRTHFGEFQDRLYSYQ